MKSYNRYIGKITKMYSFNFFYINRYNGGSSTAFYRKLKCLIEY